MIVLGIDSSTDALGIGLADTGRVIAEKALESPREHSSRIIGLIDEVIIGASITKSDLGGVAAAIGPGSFTGLRVGLTVAKGMAVALNIPIVGISTFEVIRRRLQDKFDRFYLAAPVRRGEYYLCLLEPGIEIQKNIRLVGEEDLPNAIGSMPWGLIGGKTMEAPLPTENEIAAEKLYISGGELALHGVRRIAAGDTDNPATLEPLYIAPSQAERKFGRN